MLLFLAHHLATTVGSKTEPLFLYIIFRTELPYFIFSHPRVYTSYIVAHPRGYTTPAITWIVAVALMSS